VLSFGAGALISAVSFDLFEEGQRIGGPGTVAIGLAAGALTYFVFDRLVERVGAGASLALGALLDGIPEQMVLGIGLAGGEKVSIGLLAAIYVSNLPEGVGGATELEAAGRSRRQVLRLWVAVAVACALATPLGYALIDITSDDIQGGINGFAAGALLVMLVDSMIPDATEQAGRTTGLVTTLGFAVGAGLSLA
jgi:zinc transporter, ZIP family